MGVLLVLSRRLPPRWLESVIKRLIGERLDIFRVAWTAALHHPHHLRLPRFDRKVIDEMIKWADRRFPEAERYLLADQDAELIPYDFERAGIVPLDHPQAAAFSDRPRVFFCIYDCDSSLAETLDEIRTMENAFYYTPKAYLPTARVFHRDPVARGVLQTLAPSDDKVDTWDLADHENIIQALSQTRDLPGSYVEIGVYRGASAELALAYLENARIRRRCWFLDLFEGFTYEEAQDSADAFWSGQFSSTSMGRVAGRLEGYRNKTLVRCNIITDDLPSEIERIAVCNIDVDLYEAVTAALEKTTPRLVSGGLILVEDQGHTPNIAGGYLALKHFLETEAGREYFCWNLTSGQALLRKK